jgi:hypothetical protein
VNVGAGWVAPSERLVNCGGGGDDFSKKLDGDTDAEANPALEKEEKEDGCAGCGAPNEKEDSDCGGWFEPEEANA